MAQELWGHSDVTCCTSMGQTLLLRVQPFLTEQGPPQPLTASSSSSPCAHSMPFSVDSLTKSAFGEEAD